MRNEKDISSAMPDAGASAMGEDSAFPSDSYAVASHAAFRGLDPADAVVRVRPLPGRETLDTDAVAAGLAQEHADGQRAAPVRPFAQLAASRDLDEFTRVALREGSLVVNSSQGGGTKDTWVLEA